MTAPHSRTSATRPRPQHRWTWPLRPALALALAAAVAGCDRDGSADAVGDAPSGGIVVSDRPVLVLEEDGTEEKLFTRVVARRMPGGEIAVADGGTFTIHLFGRDGALVRTLARHGKGPGELEGNVTVTSHGDTVFTFGMAPMSPPDVSVYVAGEGFVHRFRPRPSNARTVTVVDRLSTGELVVQRGAGFRAFAELPPAGRLMPDSVVHGLLPVEGGEARGEVTWLPATTRGWLVTHDWPGGPVPVTMSAHDLQPRGFAVASGDRLWIVDGATGALRAVDGAGREVATGRVGVEPRPFDGAALDRRRAAALRLATGARDSLRVRATHDQSLLPATMPVISAAHAGADGELWLRLLDLDDDAPQRFVIIGRDGAVVGRATLPARLEVQHVGRDFVLGVSRDSLGVESVREYALRR